jgi:mannan endo-1,4-beta-mannosidase
VATSQCRLEHESEHQMTIMRRATYIAELARRSPYLRLLLDLDIRGHCSVVRAVIGITLLIAGLFYFKLSTANTSFTPPLPEYVSTDGTHFVLNGKRFNVAGVNNHYLTFGSREEVLRVLDDAKSMGANVIRTFVQPVIGSLHRGSALTIWDWNRKAKSSDLSVHGNYILYWDDASGQMGINDGADGLQNLDWLLVEASKRRLKLIIAFLDFWAYTGGIQQMRAWYGSANKNTFFFSDPRTRSDYRRFVNHVILRVNAINGRLYRDDPTIFAWELANEPNIKPSNLMRSWIADMSAFVKSIDGNHLITSGQANQEGKLTDIDIDSLDFATWHGYPKYMGQTADEFDQTLTSYCGQAKLHGKPVLLEEFGLARSSGTQAAAYERWLRIMSSDPDCAGWLVWRLVSKQDDGAYPEDNYDQFDVHNDSDFTWKVLSGAAHAATADQQ